MKKNFGQILAVGSLVVGGSFLGVNPVNAINLVANDFVTLSIRAKVDGTSAFPQLVNEVLFAEQTGPIGPTTTFAPVGSMGVAEVASSFFSDLGGGLPNPTIANIKSFNLDPAFGDFALTSPLDLGGTNSFVATGFSNPIFTIDLGGGDGLEFSLLDFTTTQSQDLPNVPNFVTFSGNGTLRSLIPDNTETSKVTFATTLNFNPAIDGFVSAGDITITVQDTPKAVPEPSNLVGLVGLGLLGSFVVAKRKKEVIG